MDVLKKSWKWLKWVVAIGLLASLYFQNQKGLHDIWNGPKRYEFFALALALCSLSTLVTFLRWYLLVWAQGFPFRIQDALRLGFIGLLFNYVGPGSVGGDLFKAIFLAREQSSRRVVAVATILLDRILGVLALFLVGAATLLPSLLRTGIPVERHLQIIAAALLGGSLAGVIGLGLMMYPGFTRWNWVKRLAHLPVVGRMAGDLINGVGLYQAKRRVIGISMLLSIVGHAGLIAGFFCGAMAVCDWAPSLASHFYFMPIAELFGVLVPTPGGLGALEKAIQQFYIEFSPEEITRVHAEAAGLAAAVVFRINTVAIASIGGIYYLLSRGEVRSAMQAADALQQQGLPGDAGP